MKSWKVLSSKRVFNSPYLRVRSDECLLPNGRRIRDYFVIESRDWNVIFALTRNGKVPLVRQYKHGAGRIVLELPAGVCEPDEKPADAIRRELREETGYAVKGRMEEIFTFIPEPSQRANRAHAFFARGAEKTRGQDLDGTEEIEVELSTPKELLTLVREKKIVTPGHVAAILMVREGHPELF
ncbi:NUDIX hydrolase [Candidatus Micrarchaeota archaeon]|nr:NUDIX hydrolase [Candidatus Micrarchaeota archaeon]MBI5176837.1 NUDIX hydrolase [Candidatus Micrarchaeota archaeon]